MEYISTRGNAPVLGFEEAVLAGLAEDGGLYVPAEWPRLSPADIAALRGLSYAEIALKVIAPYVDGAIPENDLKDLIDRAYAEFDHPAVAPLRQLDSDLWLLELYHGPTLAFKDFALQLLGRLFDYILARRGERVTVVGATSGDTGSAAIEACRDRDSVDIIILHPNGRTSEIQRRQMTTVDAPNVHNIALDGTFDDCQDLVKAMFGDAGFRAEMNLSAVNSINWARIMAQIVYYFSSAVALGAPERKIAYSVPTGNFGDIFAGYAALQMGLPIEKLIIATNANDILTRFVETGEMSARPVVPTLSPAMDIQVSSNFERLMFDLSGRDARAVSQSMASFRESGVMTMAAEQLGALRGMFSAARLDDDGIRAVIKNTFEKSGVLIDPHTATGIHAAGACAPGGDVPLVVLSTAHPAKFPEAVEAASGRHPELPARLAPILTAEEHCVTLPNDLGEVQAFVRDKARG